MQNIILLGHNGNIGNSILNSLRKNKKVNIFVTKNRNIQKLFRDVKKIDFIINCVGEYKNKKNFLNSNFFFIKKILTSIKKTKSKPTLIHFSTCAIYENVKENIIDNKVDISSTSSLYSKTKLLAEKHIISESKKGYFKYLIIRIPLVISENSHNSSLQKIRKLLKYNFIFCISDLDYLYNYVLFQDLISFIKKSIKIKSKKINKTVIISENITYRNLVKLFLFRFNLRLNKFEILISKLMSLIIFLLDNLKFNKINIIKTLTNKKNYITSNNIKTNKINKKNIFNFV